MDGRSIFEQALNMSNLEQAAKDLHVLYTEFQKAGFTKHEALMILIAMIQPKKVQ